MQELVPPRESPMPGHCTHCLRQSPGRVTLAASRYTDATASAASSMSTGMPLYLRG
jgi:hypothetical protein